jgi:nicotinamide phosphoribosyltransferase
MNLRHPSGNPILNTDRYKASHWLQYPTCNHVSFLCVESREGTRDDVPFFGLQAILKAHFSAPITHADVDEARDVFVARGEPFNEAG